MKALFASLFFVAFLPLNALADCPKLSLAQLKELTATKGAKHLVFFSTWCSSCKEHLLKEDKPGTIFIAAFDTPERASAVIQKLNIKQPCYFDDGLTNYFGIKVVPAERVYPSL